MIIEWTRGRREKGQVDEAGTIPFAVVMNARCIRQFEVELVRHPAGPKRTKVYIAMKREHMKYTLVSYNTRLFVCAGQG